MNKLKIELKKIFAEPKIPIGIFLVFIVFALGVAWFAATRAATDLSSNLSVRHGIGELVAAKDASLTVESVRYDSTGSGPLMPKAGHVFAGVTIVLRNNTERPFDLIPLLHFHVKDESGSIYEVAVIPSHSTQLGGLVLAHDNIREELGFEVPKGAGRLTLYFEPGISDRSIIAIGLGEAPK